MSRFSQLGKKEILLPDLAMRRTRTPFSPSARGSLYAFSPSHQVSRASLAPFATFHRARDSWVDIQSCTDVRVLQRSRQRHLSSPGLLEHRCSDRRFSP